MDLFTKILTGIIVVVLVALLLSLPVMWLWNAVMPDVFGLIEIDWAQAICLNVLGSLLFGGRSSNN